MPSGSLTVVGTGIHLAGDLTLAAKAWIEQADKVLFAVADPVTADWLRTLNATAEALPANTGFQRRRALHRAMVERILAEVRQGLRVCAVFYGHPGVFTDPAHAAMRQAQREGFSARMLPGISSEDCLFADLGLDPGQCGCQSFEATDFLIRRRRFDPTSALLLWQIAVIGHLGFYQEQCHLHGLRVLAEVLQRWYAPEHEVVVYEAAVYPVCEPVVQRLPLCKLPEAVITEVSTLYVPPRSLALVDEAMMARLEMPVTRPAAREFAA
ncbi:MAG TPA: SAM-dependent methyltransferase [Caldilineaceae bacterium]|nr:SAM-dependent methyltransferase [Caldilineaceae bacterium]